MNTGHVHTFFWYSLCPKAMTLLSLVATNLIWATIMSHLDDWILTPNPSPYSSISFLHKTARGTTSTNQTVSLPCLNTPMVNRSYNEIHTFPTRLIWPHACPPLWSQVLPFFPAHTALWPHGPSFCSSNMWSSSPPFPCLSLYLEYPNSRPFHGWLLLFTEEDMLCPQWGCPNLN